jgi:hypothetical protein
LCQSIVLAMTAKTLWIISIYNYCLIPFFIHFND